MKNLPFSLIEESVKLNDTTEYIEKLRRNFDHLYNLKTRSLPLESTDDRNGSGDDTLIADGLFEQFYKQKQNVSDNTQWTDPNFNREFYYTHAIRWKTYSEDYHFLLFINAFVNSMEITNKNNYQKLICVMLNSLSIWFNFCILDAYVWLEGLICFIIALYEWLVKYRNRLGIFDD